MPTLKYSRMAMLLSHAFHKELFDAGVLSQEAFTVDPGIRSAMLYKEHTSAMTMETQNAATYAHNAESTHEYGMMPFWNGNDPDSGYLVSAPGFNIYANKRLEKPENSIISVKNMDGSEFDLQKTYKVAIWNGCFSNLSEMEFFDAETLAAMEDVTAVSEKTSTELIKAAVKEAEEIEPPDDGCFTIRWDITPQAEAE